MEMSGNVRELLGLLGVTDTTAVSAEIYNVLSTSDASAVPKEHCIPAIVQHLKENNISSQGFIQKYEELKRKNVKNVDEILCLIMSIIKDPKTTSSLAKNAHGRMVDVLRESLLKDQAQSSGLSVSKSAGPLVKKSGYETLKFPSWYRERLFLKMDFVTELNACGDHGRTLGALPLSSQEQALLEDIMFCLVGVQGEYVYPVAAQSRDAAISFKMDETIDQSFQELATRILPICIDYSTIVRFIDANAEFGKGQIIHALCSAMRTIIKDFLILVAQAEYKLHQGTLTLQKLWYYLQPYFKKLNILAFFAASITKNGIFGGKVLSLLHDTTSNSMGDPESQEICLHITQLAAVPYFEILERWIYKGIINDPFKEFLVDDNELMHKEELPLYYSDDYWEKRYTICREQIPTFLGKVSDKIVRTGKYLNVVRQCDQDVKCPDAEVITYTLIERQYVDKIDKSYRFASKKLLNLLMEETDLMGRLRSVKHYFLLDQGDFIVQFMDMAEEEMKKNIDDIMPTRLESLLELALRTSVANVDPYKDDVLVELLPYDLLFQMFKILSIHTKDEKDYQFPNIHKLTGLEAFSFGYEVKWPLSLILNSKAIACYQMLFRLLLFSKHVERSLCSVWISSKVAKSFPLRTCRCYYSAFELRQRMLNFVQNLEYYMMFEVLEPNWHFFLNNLQSVNNVDDVLQCHGDFLNNCLKDCMLTSPELLGLVNTLMSNCISFSEFILEMNKYVADAELDVVDHSAEAASVNEGQESSETKTKSAVSFQEKIRQYDREFTNSIIVLLDKISDLGRENYNEKLVNILYRIDFNGFYTARLEKYSVERSMRGSQFGLEPT